MGLVSISGEDFCPHRPYADWFHQLPRHMDRHVDRQQSSLLKLFATPSMAMLSHGLAFRGPTMVRQLTIVAGLEQLPNIQRALAEKAS